MKKVYIAAPLFNEMELKRNLEIADYLKKLDMIHIFHRMKLG